ncbi:MAG: transporter [Prevotellaceae bacterium]|jgi:putative transport protein|nr:transporter [Prevotellaceae bacterium]
MYNLLSSSYFLLFLIIAIGLIFGRIKIKGISLESSAVIFVALLLGHWGYTLPKVVQNIGLVFFIFTIGMQAGPGFFRSFMKDGRKLVILATAVVATATLTLWIFGRLLGLEKGLVIGLFNGALTSTPGLAAAVEISGSPLAPIGYSIAYPLGVILVILFLQLVPAILKINFRKCEKEYEAQQQETIDQIISKNIRVENANIDGKTIQELHIRATTGCAISRVKHEGVTTTPDKSTILHLGDVLRVVGSEHDLRGAEYFIGSAVDEALELSHEHSVDWVLVTNKSVINKPLKKLDLFANFDTTIVRIRRAGIDLAPTGNMMLRFGDRVQVASRKNSKEQVIKLLGNDNKRLSSTDFLPIALGILIGVALGKISIPVFGIDVNLGVTGGVLTAALVLSALGKTGPIIWSMSGSANQIFRELGLLFFLAGVGTEAGKDMAGALAQHGVIPVAIGIAVTLLPLAVGMIVGRWALKLNFLTLLGVLAGGMTSTPGLSAVTSKSDTNIAQLAYATVYPFALVLMIIFSTLLFYI